MLKIGLVLAGLTARPVEDEDGRVGLVAVRHLGRVVNGVTAYGLIGLDGGFLGRKVTLLQVGGFDFTAGCDGLAEIFTDVSLVVRIELNKGTKDNQGQESKA